MCPSSVVRRPSSVARRPSPVARRPSRSSTGQYIHPSINQSIEHLLINKRDVISFIATIIPLALSPHPSAFTHRLRPASSHIHLYLIEYSKSPNRSRNLEGGLEPGRWKMEPSWRAKQQLLNDLSGTVLVLVLTLAGAIGRRDSVTVWERGNMGVRG